MKKVFGAFALVVLLTGAGCAGRVSEIPSDNGSTESGRSTALQFHIDTAASDLRSAIEDGVDGNFQATRGSVTFAALTLPSA